MSLVRNQLSDVQKAKSRQIFNAPKFSVSCDHTIHSRGSSGALWDSHDLLAACNRRPKPAWGEDGDGIFTRALLKVIGKTPISELAYRSLFASSSYSTIVSVGLIRVTLN